MEQHVTGYKRRTPKPFQPGPPGKKQFRKPPQPEVPNSKALLLDDILNSVRTILSYQDEQHLTTLAGYLQQFSTQILNRWVVPSIVTAQDLNFVRKSSCRKYIGSLLRCLANITFKDSFELHFLGDRNYDYYGDILLDQSNFLNFFQQRHIRLVKMSPLQCVGLMIDCDLSFVSYGSIYSYLKHQGYGILRSVSGISRLRQHFTTTIVKQLRISPLSGGIMIFIGKLLAQAKEWISTGVGTTHVFGEGPLPQIHQEAVKTILRVDGTPAESLKASFLFFGITFVINGKEIYFKPSEYSDQLSVFPIGAFRKAETGANILPILHQIRGAFILSGVADSSLFSIDGGLFFKLFGGSSAKDATCPFCPCKLNQFNTCSCDHNIESENDLFWITSPNADDQATLRFWLFRFEHCTLHADLRFSARLVEMLHTRVQTSSFWFPRLVTVFKAYKLPCEVYLCKKTNQEKFKPLRQEQAAVLFDFIEQICCYCVAPDEDLVDSRTSTVLDKPPRSSMLRVLYYWKFGRYRRFLNPIPPGEMNSTFTNAYYDDPNHFFDIGTDDIDTDVNFDQRIASIYSDLTDDQVFQLYCRANNFRANLLRTNSKAKKWISLFKRAIDLFRVVKYGVSGIWNLNDLDSELCGLRESGRTLAQEWSTTFGKILWYEHLTFMHPHIALRRYPFGLHCLAQTSFERFNKFAKKIARTSTFGCGTSKWVQELPRQDSELDINDLFNSNGVETLTENDLVRWIFSQVEEPGLSFHELHNEMDIELYQQESELIFSSMFLENFQQVITGTLPRTSCVNTSLGSIKFIHNLLH